MGNSTTRLIRTKPLVLCSYGPNSNGPYSYGLCSYGLRLIGIQGLRDQYGPRPQREGGQVSHVAQVGALFPGQGLDWPAGRGARD